jgi:hypothetical protein
MSSDSDLARGDARTLSLASLRIDGELLERLLRYQRVLADRLTAGWTAGSLAQAQEEALQAAGLQPQAVEPLLAVLRRFAGNRRVATELRRRAPEIKGERAKDLSQRLAELDRQLTERDDPETVRRFLEREAEILELHARTEESLRR